MERSFLPYFHGKIIPSTWRKILRQWNGYNKLHTRNQIKNKNKVKLPISSHFFQFFHTKRSLSNLFNECAFYLILFVSWPSLTEKSIYSSIKVHSWLLWKPILSARQLRPLFQLIILSLLMPNRVSTRTRDWLNSRSSSLIILISPSICSFSWVYDNKSISSSKSISIWSIICCACLIFFFFIISNLWDRQWSFRALQ